MFACHIFHLQYIIYVGPTLPILFSFKFYCWLVYSYLPIAKDNMIMYFGENEVAACGNNSKLCNYD